MRGKVIIDGAAHWVQVERPEAVNKALLGFLKACHKTHAVCRRGQRRRDFDGNDFHIANLECVHQLPS